ncbi:phosphate ABC transporter permease subunit PstC, partial [bacterium]|nr:phosphate ABC transporter permease subunit PstC [bacterium]
MKSRSSYSWSEYAISSIIKVLGYSAIIFVSLIFIFLLRSGLPTLREVDFQSLFGTRWYPIEDYFGILPLIGGTLIVTVGAAIIAIPFGIGTAIYIAEIGPNMVREILKPLVEVLGGLPSVVLGFIGFLILAPYIRRILNL